MRGIGEASMGEGVAHQQVAEFVVNARGGHVKKWERGESNGNDPEKQTEDDEITTLCELGKQRFQAGNYFFGGTASQESQGEKYQHEQHDPLQRVKEEYEGKEICGECIQGKVWWHVRVSITYLVRGLEGTAAVAWRGNRV